MVVRRELDLRDAAVYLHLRDAPALQRVPIAEIRFRSFAQLDDHATMVERNGVRRCAGLISAKQAVAPVGDAVFHGVTGDLGWVKGRHSGIVLQGKRAGDTDWVDLGKYNYSFHVDGRSPLTASTSETRQYRTRYLDKDDEVGEWSDVVAAVAAA